MISTIVRWTRAVYDILMNEGIFYKDGNEMDILHNDWQAYLEEEFSKDYYIQLHDFLRTAYQTEIIYPEMHDIFNALHYTDFRDVKVVILGQDPYHGPHQAHGLSFSVQPGVPPPPSLKNMFIELENDVGAAQPNHGHLVDWTKQGVLLLNTVLTVEKGKAHSHRKKGWEQFTNQVIRRLNEKATPIVYILWGRAAQDKEKLIDTSKHEVIKSVHPSPLSAYRGFFGSKPFSKTNDFLQASGQNPVDWRISAL